MAIEVEGSTQIYADFDSGVTNVEETQVLTRGERKLRLLQASNRDGLIGEMLEPAGDYQFLLDSIREYSQLMASKSLGEIDVIQEDNLKHYSQVLELALGDYKDLVLTIWDLSLHKGLVFLQSTH